MTKRNSLARADWIKAGFEALNKAGVQGLKIEALARKLGVSKGSFYWHFEDAPALTTAMLEHWSDLATHTIIDEVVKTEADPADQLRLLVRLATQATPARPQRSGISEATIRNWARHNARAARTLKKIEAERLGFIETLFTEMGVDWKASRVKANILYGTLIGLEHLAHHKLAAPEHDLPALLELLIADQV